jgi:hypothetical protein
MPVASKLHVLCGYIGDAEAINIGQFCSKPFIQRPESLAPTRWYLQPTKDTLLSPHINVIVSQGL